MQDDLSRVQDYLSHTQDFISYMQDDLSYMKECLSIMQDCLSCVQDYLSCVKDDLSSVKEYLSSVKEYLSSSQGYLSNVQSLLGLVIDRQELVIDFLSRMEDCELRRIDGQVVTGRTSACGAASAASASEPMVGVALPRPLEPGPFECRQRTRPIRERMVATLPPRFARRRCARFESRPTRCGAFPTHSPLIQLLRKRLLDD